MQENFGGIGLAEGFLRAVSEAIRGRNPKQIKDFLKNAVRERQKEK